MQNSSFYLDKVLDTTITWQDIDAALVLLMLRYGPLSAASAPDLLKSEEPMEIEALAHRRISETKSSRTISNGSDFSTRRSSDSTTPDSIQNGAESLADSGVSCYVHKKYKRRCCSVNKIHEPSVKNTKDSSTQTDANVLEKNIKQENIKEFPQEDDSSCSEDEKCKLRVSSNLRNKAAPAPRFVVRAGPSRASRENVVINRKTLQAVLKSARDNDLIPIGKGKLKIPAKILRKIKWNSYSLVTRGLLEAVFPEEVLRTHSLTGKKSNAFPGKEPKSQLDPVLVNEIVLTVMEICQVPKNIVRLVITTACSDKAKKKKENIDPDF